MSLYYLTSPPIAHIATIALKGRHFSRLALICNTPGQTYAPTQRIQTYATPDLESLIREAGNDLCLACRKVLQQRNENAA